MIFWPVLFSILFFVLGLCLGSFATALSWRIPRGISIAANDDKPARSRCPHCDKALGLKDLVPLLSWLLSKGKCRYCSRKISGRYPLIEIFTGLAALGLFLSWGLTPHLVLLLLVLPFLAALIVIDLEHMILPDAVTLLCGALGLMNIALFWYESGFDSAVLLHYLSAGVFYAVFAFVLAFLMSKILKKDAMGFGDVKFYLVAGLWLGFSYFPAFLIFSGAFGVLSGVIQRKITGKERFPFGPALILSLYVCLVLQGLGIVPFVGV